MKFRKELWSISEISWWCGFVLSTIQCTLNSPGSKCSLEKNRVEGKNSNALERNTTPLLHNLYLLSFKIFAAYLENCCQSAVWQFPPAIPTPWPLMLHNKLKKETLAAIPLSKCIIENSSKEDKIVHVHAYVCMCSLQNCYGPAFPKAFCWGWYILMFCAPFEV